MTSFQVIDMESNMVLSADHFFEDEASSGQTHTVQIVFTSHCWVKRGRMSIVGSFVVLEGSLQDMF